MLQNNIATIFENPRNVELFNRNLPSELCFEEVNRYLLINIMAVFLGKYFQA